MCFLRHLSKKKLAAKPKKAVKPKAATPKKVKTPKKTAGFRFVNCEITI
jgi:hypothetical protein